MLTSKVWLNEGEESKFFMAKVINNDDLHRKVKKVPTEFINTQGKFAAYLYDRDGNLVFKLVESIDVDSYIDFIMDYTPKL